MFLRMGYAAVLVQSRSIAQRRIASGRKSAHRRRRSVSGSLLERGTGQIVLHAHDFGAGVARRGGGRVVAAGDHGRRGNGDTRVRHRHGRRPGNFLFGMVEAHGRCVHGRSGMGRGMSSGPGVGELRGVVVRHVMLIDVVEAHPAVLAVLVLNDHSHGGWMCLG